MRVPHFLPSSFADDDAFTDLPSDPLCMAFPIKGEYSATLDSPVDLSWRPIQISVSKGVKWWWRVKKWLLTIEGTGINGFAQQSIELGHEDSLLTPGTPGAIESEISLCDWFYRIGGHTFAYLLTSGTYTATISGGTLTLTPRLYYLGQGFTGIPAYQMGNVTSPDASDFLPTMGFYCDLAWDDGISISGQYVGQSYDDTAAADHDSTTAMDGETFTTRWSLVAGDDFGPITLSIEPAEYWEYENADNANPIWDETTGAQLRSVITAETI